MELPGSKMLDEEAELWQRAERCARAHRMPVSGLVMTALEQSLQNAEDIEKQ